MSPSLASARTSLKGRIRIAFETWSTVCARHVEQYSLVDSFRQVCSDGPSLPHSLRSTLTSPLDLRKRVFTHWLKTTRRVLELDRRLEARQAAERRIVFVTVFERLRERSLRKLEQQVVERRLQRELSASLLLWKERTKVSTYFSRDDVRTDAVSTDLAGDTEGQDQLETESIRRMEGSGSKSQARPSSSGKGQIDDDTTMPQCLASQLPGEGRPPICEVSPTVITSDDILTGFSCSRFRSFASSSANSPTLTTPSRSVLPTRASPPASTPTRSYSLRPSFPRTSPTPSPATPVFTSRLRSPVSPLATPRRSPTSQDVEERASEAMRSRLRAAASRAHRNE